MGKTMAEIKKMQELIKVHKAIEVLTSGKLITLQDHYYKCPICGRRFMKAQDHSCQTL